MFAKPGQLTISGIVLAAPLVLLLSAAPVFAQARGQAPTPAPAQPPAAPAAAAQAPAPAAALPPPAPFPVGAKIGFVNLQAIAQNTADGKAAAARVQKTASD